MTMPSLTPPFVRTPGGNRRCAALGPDEKGDVLLTRMKTSTQPSWLAIEGRGHMRSKWLLAGLVSGVVSLSAAGTLAESPQRTGPMGVNVAPEACVIGAEFGIEPGVTAMATTIPGALAEVGADPARYRAEPVDEDTVIMYHEKASGVRDEAFQVQNIGELSDPSWVVVSEAQIDQCDFDPSLVSPETGPAGGASVGPARGAAGGKVPANIGGETLNGH